MTPRQIIEGVASRARTLQALALLVPHTQPKALQTVLESLVALNPAQFLPLEERTADPAVEPIEENLRHVLDDIIVTLGNMTRLIQELDDIGVTLRKTDSPAAQRVGHRASDLAEQLNAVISASKIEALCQQARNGG